MKFPFAITRRSREPGLVDRSAPSQKGIDDHPDEWHAVTHQVLSPPEGRAELEARVEREVARLVESGSLDEAHGGVLDHFIEDRRRQMEEHITQHYRTRIATQAGLARRARVNNDRVCVELRDLRAEHAEALESRAHHRDLLLGRTGPEHAGATVLYDGGGADAGPASRPVVMAEPEVDTSALHGPARLAGSSERGE